MGWVRIKKAAEILRLSPETVRQWSNEGRIRCYRSAAGQRVYDEDYLRTFTDSAGGMLSLFGCFMCVPLVGRMFQSAPRRNYWKNHMGWQKRFS